MFSVIGWYKSQEQGCRVKMRIRLWMKFVPLYMCQIEERQEEEDDPKKIMDESN